MRDGENPQYPVGSQSHPKGRRRLLLGSLVAVPVCLAVVFAYFVFSRGREVQEAIAEADRLDPAWRIQEPEQKRPAIPASVTEELRLLIRNGHRASRESIHTLHATFSIGLTDLRRNSEVTTHRVEWWQAEGGRYHCSEESIRPARLGQGGSRKEPAIHQKKETVIKDRLQTSLTSSLLRNPSSVDANISIADDFTRTFISPWSRALFVAVDRPRYTFLDLLSDPKYVREVRSVEKDRKRLYQVSLVTPLGNDLETWVDPDHNFLVTKTIWFGVHKGEHERRIEQNVAAFAQVAPGVCFPKEINASHFQSASAGAEVSLVQTTRTRFSSIKINEDFASTVFTLTIPIGARVADNIEGITYQMGPGGKPAGKVMLLGEREAGDGAILRHD